MSGSSNNMLAALLVVGLMIGAGLGYFMAPDVDQGSSPYKAGYNEGYDDGYAQGQESTGIVTEDQDITTVITLIYGAIGASLIAALVAIVTLMEVSRRR